ncbi:MAG: YjbH domain-containing protein [Celeribacter sp.]
MLRRALITTSLCCLGLSAATGLTAEPALTSGLNSFGGPGLIEMPFALAHPDGQLSVTSSYFQNNLRNTLSFQITPRLSGSFTYANITDITRGTEVVELFDRSFSLHYQLADEGVWQPALAFGLNDVLGTGVYRSEYVVATKTLTPQLRVTGGIGWGRLAGVGGFTNPLGLIDDSFETRDARDGNLGGEVELDQIFNGPAALFGGIEYQATDKLKFILEYSSDDYPYEGESSFDYRSPVNVGLSYRPRPDLDLSARYLYGSQLGLQATFFIDPKSARAPSGLEKAPPPVRRRSAAELGWPQDTGWAASPAERDTIALQAAQILTAQGIDLVGLVLKPDHARVEIINDTYLEHPEAIGRSARAMTRVLPASVQQIEVVLVVNGMPASATTLQRRDLEDLEFAFDNSWSIFARARISDAPGPLAPLPGSYPRFEWDLGPYVTPSLFDPDAPLRADLGVELNTRYAPAPGLLFRGQLRKKLIGNLDETTRQSDSVLPRVRSDYNLYDTEADPRLTELTGAWFFRPGRNLYGRVSAGYLEQYFGGVSAELLWKPVTSDFALGVEANYVAKRDYDMLFGFQDYEVATGHVSAYYEWDNGYFGQIDVGRYLAGDWGTTLKLERTFKNGWRVGAFATFTDVSFEEFGEGSFDKGITVTIPIGQVTGQPSRDTYTTVLRPVQRDGGARLDVSDRLYGLVHDAHTPELQESWGRFWR